MLIRFSLENYLSIRDHQEISLVASSLKDDGATLFPIPNSNLLLLPAAVLYGANASGKSNFIRGMQFLCNMIRFSHERGDPNSKIPRSPFLFQKKFRDAPTTCEAEFILNEIRYRYGFSCNNEAFVKEWLYAYPSGKQQTLFLREPDRKRIYFGKNLKGNSRTVETLMRPNSLYLSVAAQNAHDQLTPIYTYLTEFAFKFGIENHSHHAKFAFIDGQFDRRIIDLLKHADTGISDYRFEEPAAVPEGVSGFVTEFTALMRKHVSSEIDLPDFTKSKEISFGHAAAGGKPVFMDLDSESSGTLRLLVLFREIFLALDRGSLLAIDEIDASLHTYLVEDIVALFNSKTSNRKGAQLIATTHDTNLLSGKLLRRDQIWFVEKDDIGASTLYPLTDIRTRNTDNIEKGYLEGRFGAVPFKGRIDHLFGAKD
jgi:AAA15 family ATPase/GTPase